MIILLKLTMKSAYLIFFLFKNKIKFNFFIYLFLGNLFFFLFFNIFQRYYKENDKLVL